MFGYDIESGIDGEFTSDPKFVAHSTQLIGMFDQALQMLGPNGKLLAEQIAELGEKHYNYGVRAEMYGIEKVVIHPAVHHVDALFALGRAHVHDIAATHQVTALDELDAHLAGQKRVLKIC